MHGSAIEEVLLGSVPVASLLSAFGVLQLFEVYDHMLGCLELSIPLGGIFLISIPLPRGHAVKPVPEISQSDLKPRTLYQYYSRWHPTLGRTALVQASQSAFLTRHPSPSSLERFSNASSSVINPVSLAHILLQTTPANFPHVVRFYRIFLSATASHEADRVAFLTYDDEHHGVAIAARPGVVEREEKAAGMCGTLRARPGDGVRAEEGRGRVEAGAWCRVGV
ncbi:hypothetical protein B0J12DRAFT_762397 [Macrophomina phaseolina]|uniref:Uncharacterized protein n=1 Tax=Macrophomina phaseolina TaxID=35725 RepID=A0ABQ8G0Z4_9PEZI|nr:hypothetical protein B0J12DRAFT_762397 [Macrophomina phaseolina]